MKRRKASKRLEKRRRKQPPLPKTRIEIDLTEPSPKTVQHAAGGVLELHRERPNPIAHGKRRVGREFRDLVDRKILKYAPKDVTEAARESNTFWYIHDVLKYWINRVFGEIQFEPYADTRSAKRTEPWFRYGFQDSKCKKLYDANDLAIPWLRTATFTFTNHPWCKGNQHFTKDFSKKMISELNENVKDRLILSLVPESDARWYTDLYEHRNCVAEITIAKTSFNNHTKFTVVNRKGKIQKSGDGKPKGARNGRIAFLIFAHVDDRNGSFPESAISKIRKFVSGLKSVYEKENRRGSRRMVELRFTKE